MLEPRRLAARAAARRIAHLLGQEPGGLVGYQTRDERVIGPSTRIEIVTEGILTRRLQSDPSIDGCGIVIFDEVHERNLPTDLGLALCLDSRTNLRPDLRILAMSATADAQRFAGVLGSRDEPAPVVRSEGRMFDVDIVWAPPSRNQRLEEAVASVVKRALREHGGDALVFLPGIAEIERVRRMLSGTDMPPDVDVRPLAGTLSPEDQDLALSPSPSGRRRVVLSTDIAETSLTVEGVRIVVDAGQARIPQFDTRTGMTRLTTVAASRASCEQRSGRAGRVEPGVAYRLWSKLEHGTRRAHLDPEIAQADLASFALDLAMWGTPVENLSFLDDPPRSSLAQAQGLLTELGALDDRGGVTDLGKSMLGLPVHPRLAKMIAAAEPSDTSTASLLAALVDERDILRGPQDSKPTDMLVRIEIVAGAGDHPRAHELGVDRNTIRRLRVRAEDLARRSGHRMDWDGVAAERAAALLLLAYPDRVAIRRQPGQFQTIGGSAAWIPRTDPLAEVDFVVAADLDGNRKSARIRLALAVDEEDLRRSLGDAVEEQRTVKWDKDRGDFVEHTTLRLGGMRVSERKSRPHASAATSAAIFEHLEQRRFSALLDQPKCNLLISRVEFLRRSFENDSVEEGSWPDWSRSSLVSSAREWLEPYLAGMTSISEVESLDAAVLLRSHLPWTLGARLDELAPTSLTVASGRSLPIDYRSALDDGGAPRVDVRVQDMFGTREHPVIVGGRIRLVLRLLSPADRPIQITSDLPSFWTGSWAEVRKELAGRYPKHNWPIDPATAEPKRMKEK